MIETTCAHCGKPVDGYVIRGDVLLADDIVAMFSGRITRETVNEWFVARILSGRKTKGIRGWWTTVAEFEADMKRMRRRPGTNAAAQPATPRGEQVRLVVVSE